MTRLLSVIILLSLSAFMPVHVAGESEEPPAAEPNFIALRTNALLDAALIPNATFEVGFAGKWSVATSWMHAWWSGDGKFWRIYGGTAEGRLWLGEAARRKLLTGHHVGAIFGVSTYDFKLGHTGVQSPTPTWTAGITYGYSFPVRERLNIDIGLGLGFIGGHYTKYRYECGRYVCSGRHRLAWWGPVKAEISIVWLLGTGNRNNFTQRR